MSKFPFPINLGGDDSQLTQWLETLPKGSDLTHLVVPTDDRAIRFEKNLNSFGHPRLLNYREILDSSNLKRSQIVGSWHLIQPVIVTLKFGYLPSLLMVLPSKLID